jgi:predicted MFS family arabinose efflux permease
MRRRLPLALQQRDFAIFVAVVGSMGFASQMVEVAVGWQVYGIHHRAFDLGLIGLLEFAPVFLLALPAGQLVDRVSRRLVFGVSVIVLLAITSVLFAISATGVHALWPFLLLAAANGVATALSFPVTRALPAMLIDRSLLASGLALRSVTNQAATVVGPAIGGVLFAAAPEAVYGAALVLLLVALAGVAALHVPPGSTGPARDAPPLQALLGGIHFIRDTPILLGAILLDLFAVLFGGAVALLPVFAQSVLHTGPIGLGILRSAPAVGAVVTGFMLVRRPRRSRTGPTLLSSVAVFGASMIVFGLSHWIVLSLAALAVSGAVDMVSVNIRTTTASLATPDHLRGRVGSVESVFIGASNQLGAFESGAAAALLGAVTSVVLGGGLTILIALAWIRLFPQLARLGDADSVRPPATVAPATTAPE